jgi:hypothetical protein
VDQAVAYTLSRSMKQDLINKAAVLKSPGGTGLLTSNR